MSASVSPSGDLSRLFARHRVIVCVGAGGVGKTTVAAALALAAARSGKRTLCLTIDPARRLAESLGLSAFPRQEMEVPAGFFEEHGLTLRAPLTVMMLDARETFDSLISRFARDAKEAERITSHKIYHHLASRLAGTQAYMAMEKVLSVLGDDRYDLIVLDTPPAARALDFFDAPDKMAEILDSPATRALVGAIDQGKKFHFGVIALGLERAMKSLEKITGTSLIGDLAGLLAEMNGLFGGFASRAKDVSQRLRQSEFGYVLVTAPEEGPIVDALALFRSMKERGLRLDAVAINRVVEPGLDDPTLADLALLNAGNGLSAEGQETALRLVVEQGELRRRQLAQCRPLLSELGQAVLSAYLPAFPEDVHEPDKLMAVADVLAPLES